MIPTDALDRLLERAEIVQRFCEQTDLSQWDIVGVQGYSEGVEIEAGKISLAGGSGEGGFGIRVVEDGRFGFAHIVDPNDIEQAITLSRKIAKMSPQIKGFELPSHEAADKVEGMFDRTIVETTSEDLLQEAEDILSYTASSNDKATVTGGGIDVSMTASCLITSSGIEESGQSTSNSLGVQISIEGDTFSSSYDSTTSRKKIETPSTCIDEAMYWAESTQNPLKHTLSTEDCNVIFTPSSFSRLFGYIVPNSLLGERLARNISVWSQQMGNHVIDDALSLTNHGRLEGGLTSSSRDDDGVPTQITTLIENGILKSSLWSTRDAAELLHEGLVDKATSTGSAFRSSYQSPPVTSSSEMMLTTSKTQHERDALCEMVGNGYIIQDVMGAHTANPSSGDFSVTSSTILRIEHGEIVGPISQAGVSGNLISALRSNVELGSSIVTKGRYHIPDVLLQSNIRVNPA